ncbi:MAG: hypothetical protein ACI9K5_001816, partial [Gammaproteobacteria bacterium]
AACASTAGGNSVTGTAVLTAVCPSDVLDAECAAGQKGHGQKKSLHDWLLNGKQVSDGRWIVLLRPIQLAAMEDQFESYGPYLHPPVCKRRSNLVAVRE